MSMQRELNQGRHYYLDPSDKVTSRWESVMSGLWFISKHVCGYAVTFSFICITSGRRGSFVVPNGHWLALRNTIMDNNTIQYNFITPTRGNLFGQLVVHILTCKQQIHVHNYGEFSSRIAEGINNRVVVIIIEITITVSLALLLLLLL